MLRPPAAKAVRRRSPPLLALTLVALLLVVPMPSSVSAVLRARDFVIATSTGSPHSPALIRASAGCRRGVRLYVATNQSVYLSNPPGEFWSYYPDDPELVPRLQPGDSRAAQSPWLAFNYYGLSFKWLLYGEDDTVFFVDKVIDMVKGLDYEQPIVLADRYWWSQGGHTPRSAGLTEPPAGDGSGLRAGPTCVPCGFKEHAPAGHAARDTPYPEACPACNTTVLCEAEATSHFFDASNCTRAGLAQGVHPAPFHGGAGAAISIGALRAIPYKQLRACVVGDTSAQGGGADATLAACILQAGIAATDPGYHIMHPGFTRFDTLAGDTQGLLECLRQPPGRKASKACAQRLRAQASAHADMGSFKSPAAAAEYLSDLCFAYSEHLGLLHDEV